MAAFPAIICIPPCYILQLGLRNHMGDLSHIDYVAAKTKFQRA